MVSDNHPRHYFMTSRRTLVFSTVSIVCAAIFLYWTIIPQAHHLFDWSQAMVTITASQAGLAGESGMIQAEKFTPE